MIFLVVHKVYIRLYDGQKFYIPKFVVQKWVRPKNDVLIEHSFFWKVIFVHFSSIREESQIRRLSSLMDCTVRMHFNVMALTPFFRLSKLLYTIAARG